MNNKKVLPYVYRGTHILTGHFYIGYRSANTVPAVDDIGIIYTSSSSSVMIEKEFDKFTWEVIQEFESPIEAFIYEQLLIRDNKDNELILNKHWCDPINGEFNPVGMSGKNHPAFGKSWYNNGVTTILSLECPDGYTLGRIDVAGKNHPLYDIGHTEESCKKMSESRKGYQYSELTKANMSKSAMGNKNGSGCLGSKHTPERVSRLIETLRGNTRGSGNKGRVFSEDTLTKMSQNHADVSGEKNPMYGKRAFNNGVINGMFFECPDGFVPGRIKIPNQDRII